MDDKTKEMLLRDALQVALNSELKITRMRRFMIIQTIVILLLIIINVI